MSRFDRATLAHVFLMIVILALAVATIAHGDDLAGTPRDDAKEMAPIGRAPVDYGFQPLPSWARSAVIPPLPQTLQPMGTKVVVLTTPPVAAHEPLTPPKEAAAPAPVVKVARPAPPAPNPALVAVSPFLQWIKANPQAAAAQARDQAGIYQAGPDANGPGAGAAVVPGSGPASATGPTASSNPADAPYWMPPLIDSSTFSSTPSGSSAAIYSTPQR